MEKFSKHTGVAAPMLMTNINTDLIAPSLMPGRTPEEAARLPLKAKMFANLRHEKDGTPRPDFVLDQPRYRDASVLLTGPNFGCGSSRETAVWALMESGFRCVIAPSFGDIFHDNSHQNGLLPIHLEMTMIERIAEALARSNTSTITIDLERCVIEVPGLDPIGFTLPDNRRTPLLEGLDQLGFMLRSEPDIAGFEAKDEAARPWAYASVS
jgi:3-isopropylmalate/(R)-2-methylmalate dehydratase small subunit